MSNWITEIIELWPKEFQANITGVMKGPKELTVLWYFELKDEEIIGDQIDEFLNKNNIPAECNKKIINQIAYYMVKIKNEDAIKLSRISISKN